jgi:hypothetical protein
MQLLSEAMVAIDGSKFKAVNNRYRNSPSRKSSRGWNTWRRDLEKRSGVSALSIDGRSLAARATNIYRRPTVWIRRRSQFW